MKSELIAKASCGELINSAGSEIVTSVSTDSRTISSGALFVPIKGDTFDGHDFIEKAYSSGAVLALSSKPLQTRSPYVRVNDTLVSLHKIAKEYLSKINCSKICITGSTGKTTAKNILASSSPAENTVATEGNTNNLIGVPQNIFRCDKNTKNLILEMGMNTAGELEILSNTVRPTHIIITSINNSHIGNFESFEKIIEAKSEILCGYLFKERPIVINGDDSKVLSYFSSVKNATYGLKNKNDFSPDSMVMKKSSSEITMEGEKFEIKIPGLGGIYSFLALYAFIKTFPDLSFDIRRGIENFSEPSSRMNIIPLRGITLIDDSYNASPASMANAIDVLSRFTSRRVAVLSDMLELGESSVRMHREAGEELNTKSVDMLIAVGELAIHYYESFRGEKHYFENRSEMEKSIFSLLKNMDAVLVKGSHSTRMHETAKKIKEHYAL
ncbi:MAG: UDP-N-acetylmuramoyl-tripeptide--D-alanyl-D-alanine ligase [bacterium]|nr:UDP-N-acetylmuramoyl-tripeptide--D-alanyl-D-alanine ligase [bacterium]